MRYFSICKSLVPCKYLINVSYSGSVRGLKRNHKSLSVPGKLPCLPRGKEVKVDSPSYADRPVGVQKLMTCEIQMCAG